MKVWGLWVVITVATALWLTQRLPLVWIPTIFGIVSAGLIMRWPVLAESDIAPVLVAFLSVGTTMLWAMSNGVAEALWLSPILVYCFVVLTSYRALAIPWMVFVVCVLAWGVGYLSGPKGGASWMIDSIQSLLHMSRERATEVVHDLRKTFHFCFYGTNAALWDRGFQVLDPSRSGRRRLALAIVAALASMDEARQHFVATRTGSAWDVLLDLSGAATFLGVLWILDRRATARS
jgi:VanZ family protein